MVAVAVFIVYKPWVGLMVRFHDVVQVFRSPMPRVLCKLRFSFEQSARHRARENGRHDADD